MSELGCACSETDAETLDDALPFFATGVPLPLGTDADEGRDRRNVLLDVTATLVPADLPLR